MSDPFSPLADAYVGHSATLRGVVRHTLVARQLDVHLPPPPARVVDVGAGAGEQGIRLARMGYDVVLVDRSAEMLERAERALADEAAPTRDRVRIVEASAEASVSVLGRRGSDVVLCHGVLMHVDDPEPIVAAVCDLAAPAAVVSILAKNGRALAMRSALEGRWRDALAAIDAERDVGGLGVSTRGDDPSHLSSLLGARDVSVVTWYGVRVFTDHLGPVLPGADLEDILELEWRAGGREPYRQVARLIHMIGRASST